MQEIKPNTSQNSETIKQNHEVPAEKKPLPHCEIHEIFNRGCINCWHIRDRHRYVTKKSLPYYCDICNISIIKQYKKQHLLTEKHRTLSLIH